MHELNLDISLVKTEIYVLPVPWNYGDVESNIDFVGFIWKMAYASLPNTSYAKKLSFLLIQRTNSTTTPKNRICGLK